MSAQVIIELDGRVVEVRERLLLGRDPRCGLVLDDPLVSRRHCEIRPTDDGALLVLDLGSRHGTFVEGQRIQTSRASPGAEILIGRTRLRAGGQAIDRPVGQRYPVRSSYRFLRGSEIGDGDLLRRNYEKLRATYELSRAMGVEQDLGRLLQRIVSAALDLVGADSGALQLVDATTGNTAQCAGENRVDPSHPPVVSSTVIRQVMLTREAVLCEDAAFDSRFSGCASVYSEGIRSVMAVPLIAPDELLGVLMVDTLQRTGAFTPQDLELLSLIANQAALAIKGHLLAEARRADEARAARTERLALVGQLAAGIAHDFNNLLSVIGTYASFAAEAVDDPDVKGDLEVIRDSVSRGASLTRQLLAFGRRVPAAPVSTSLTALLSEMEAVLRRTLGAEIELVASLESKAKVRIDPGHVEQIVLNLSLNARDAMAGGGRLEIRCRDQRITAPLELTNDRVPPGDWVLLEVEDGGCGMSREVLGRLFEPFFTTKHPGKGNGLGLAMVYGIVHQAGGHIGVRSVAGRGTCFQVFFPASVGIDDEITLPVLPSAAAKPGASILVAEDEVQVLELTRRILIGAGYRVLTAPDGEAALSIAERELQTIDLVVADLMMPRCSGTELIERLRRQKPGLPAVLISGGADPEKRPEDVLAKPFTPEQLVARVAHAMMAPAV